MNPITLDNQTINAVTAQMPVDAKSFKILTITNMHGNINKTFTKQDGKISKTSNANVYRAWFEEHEFNSLEEFDNHLSKLAPNQAISLGRSKHGFEKGTFAVKGKENLTTNTISRSNEYMELNNPLQLCLGDIDPDDQMSDKLKSFKTPDQAYGALNELHGENFKEVSARFGYGSSYGIVDSETNDLVYSSNSMHAYWPLKNVTDNLLDQYIEYLKRRAVVTNMYYLKIHKDGSTSYRILIDLSVMKSKKSRFVFEAPATVGEGLTKLPSSSSFYNTGRGLNAFDLDSISLKGLPDWRVVYEQEKLANKEKIEAVKKAYFKEKVHALTEQGFDLKKAEKIVHQYQEHSTIDASLSIKDAENSMMSIIDLLLKGFTRIDIYDPFDQNEGLGKTFLNVKNIFNATIFTYRRGGVSYQIAFETGDILQILNKLTYREKKVDFILDTLVDYLVKNEKHSDEDIETISKVLKENGSSFEFEKRYYSRYIHHTVDKKMSDYAFMMIDGKSGILKTSEESELSLYSVKSVSDKFLPQNFFTKNPMDLSKNVKVDIVKEWMQSPNRRDYESIVFTDQKPKELEYNLFRGFAYAPINHDDVDISIFFVLVRDIICAGDELFYNVVLAFVAQIIQDPMNKLGTALVLFGKKRIGKGTFVKIIGELIGGNHYFQTSQQDKVFGRFNSQMMYSLAVYLNEAYWSGDKSTEGKFKSLITDDQMTYEIKGGAIFGGKNCTRLILDSNEKYIVPASEDEGRYICLDVSPCKKGDTVFFNATNELRNNKKAMEKLMYFFAHFDYKPYEHHLREAPRSKLFIEQVVQHFSKIKEWWYRNLQEGDIYGVTYTYDLEGIRITNESLWESFKAFHKGKTQYEKSSTFYSDLGDLMADGVMVKACKTEGKNGKIIAPLNKCRKIFSEKYLVSDFDDRTMWGTSNVMPAPYPFQVANY